MTHRHIALPTAPLRRPVFRRIWLSLAASRLGDELTLLALMWFVLQLTGSGTAMGLVLLCFQLPTILSSPIMGRLLDRYQPRWIMSIDNFCRAVIIAAIPALHGFGLLEVWHVYVLALLGGILSPGTEVGIPVVVPHLVDDDELEEANALLSIIWETGTLAGPAIAGFLVESLGGPVVLLIDAATFIFMGAATLTIPSVPRQPADPQLARHSSRLGFSTMFKMKSVLFLTTLTVLLLFIQGLQAVALAVYSQRTLSAGASAYGLLMSAFGGGSLIGLLLFNRFLVEQRRPGVALALIFVLFGLFVLPLAFLRNLPLALVFLAAGGFFAAPYFVLEASLVQRIVPAHLRGEIFGVRGAVRISGYPLGAAVGGLLLDHISAPLVIGLSCLACIGAGAGIFSHPAVRDISPAIADSQHAESGSDASAG